MKQPSSYKRLQSRMDEAMGDDAWTKLHGRNEIPKEYVPPFMQNKKQPEPQRDFVKNERERMDNLYSIEIESGFNRKKDGLPRGDPS